MGSSWFSQKNTEKCRAKNVIEMRRERVRVLSDPCREKSMCKYTKAIAILNKMRIQLFIPVDFKCDWMQYNLSMRSEKTELWWRFVCSFFIEMCGKHKLSGCICFCFLYDYGHCIIMFWCKQSNKQHWANAQNVLASSAETMHHSWKINKQPLHCIAFQI